MAKSIKELKFTLRDCENTSADIKLCNEIKWEDDSEKRLENLKDVISFTSEKEAGKNNYIVIYQNYRRLDFYKKLYEEKLEDGDAIFQNEFKSVMRSMDDNTKSYVRYARWSQIFNKLPDGSYLSCTIPNSYWRLIHSKTFEELISNWEN